MTGKDTAIGLAIFGVAVYAVAQLGLGESGSKVTASDYGDAWPLIVEEGSLECDTDQSRTIRTESGIYALNGRASDTGYQAIDPILRDDPRYPGMDVKISIAPLIEAAGELCG